MTSLNEKVEHLEFDTIEDPSVISRHDLPEIRTVIKDGQEYNLGSHQDFRNHPALKSFMERIDQFSISWTHLGPNETLPVHVHDTKSMVVVCKGQGKLIGQTQRLLREGDIVIIPEHTEHGFVGIGDDGIRTLSIQFEQNSLYARGHEARVNFVGNILVTKPAQVSSLETLKLYNKSKLEAHLKTRFFEMLTDATYDNVAKRQIFLDCLQYWSSTFQDIIMLRKFTSRNKAFLDIADKHLAEEIGHDKLLQKRDTMNPVTDPVLHAMAQWWPLQMMVLDNLEKTVLMHLILETSGSEFHKIANQKVLRDQVKSDYFQIHEECDEDHSALADHILIGQPSSTYSELARTLESGWDMLDAMLDRIVFLVDKEQASTI